MRHSTTSPSVFAGTLRRWKRHLRFRGATDKWKDTLPVQIAQTPRIRACWLCVAVPTGVAYVMTDQACVSTILHKPFAVDALLDVVVRLCSPAHLPAGREWFQRRKRGALVPTRAPTCAAACRSRPSKSRWSARWIRRSGGARARGRVPSTCWCLAPWRVRLLYSLRRQTSTRRTARSRVCLTNCTNGMQN